MGHQPSFNLSNNTDRRCGAVYRLRIEHFGKRGQVRLVTECATLAATSAAHRCAEILTARSRCGHRLSRPRRGYLLVEQDRLDKFTGTGHKRQAMHLAHSYSKPLTTVTVSLAKMNCSIGWGCFSRIDAWTQRSRAQKRDREHSFGRVGRTGAHKRHHKVRRGIRPKHSQNREPNGSFRRNPQYVVCRNY